MILSYKKQFPWKKPTDFKKKILFGIKIHTIREDPHGRWKAEKHIHHAHGVRTKNYDCFLENNCVSVQSIKIEYFFLERRSSKNQARVFIDGELFYQIDNDYQGGLPKMKRLAKNDGFNSVDDFFEWFDSDFQGRIIHWSDFRY